MNSRIRILLVEDHVLFADAVRGVLVRLGPDVQVRHVQTAELAVAALTTSQRYDLMLLDLGLPGLSGSAAFDAVFGAAQGTPIVLVTAEADSSQARSFLLRGARGYVSKSVSAVQLVQALRVVLAGGHYIPEGVMDAPALPAPPTLTARQEDVLAGLAMGRTNAEIGEQLGISEATVRVHVTAILRELGVENRTQAALTPTARALRSRRPP